MQTDFHSIVGKKWSLQRGKEGSTAKHLDTAAYKLKKMSEAADQAELRADEAEKKKLIAESRQVHAERKTQQLEDRQKQLQSDTAPLQAAAEVLLRTGNLKNGCKSAPAIKATCSISIRRRSVKSNLFKATPTFYAK